MWYVSAPWLDLRRQPIPRSKENPRNDELQETQLLQGERVFILDRQGLWVYVSALDQYVYDKSLTLQPYQGWVLEAGISETIPDFSKDNYGKSLLELGHTFQGVSYLWGGMTYCPPNDPHPNLGIDCSGLIHYLFRCNGHAIPRNAGDQYRFSKKILLNQLKFGDLIFLAKSNTPQNIYHVMLYLHGEEWLEATSDSMSVRYITTERKIGVSISDLIKGKASPLGILAYPGRI